MIIVTHDPQLLHVTLRFVSVMLEIIQREQMVALLHRWRDKG
jgi:hypothetical protein